MPTGRREITSEEAFFLKKLYGIEMVVGGAEWRARRDLSLTTDVDGKISMNQARMLRALAGKHFAKKLPKRSQVFMKSDIGEFPFVKTERERV
jgi:hypothetical protein